MNLLQALVLGAVQGATEFLPVSSSGHLVIMQILFKFKEPPVFFDILLHCGTVLSIIFFYKKNIYRYLIKYWQMIFIGTLPAVFLGLFLNNYLALIFGSITGVGISLLVTAGILFSTCSLKKGEKPIAKLSFHNSLMIGFGQAVAIMPGVSRSGAAIVAGLWQGLNREAAFLFSLLLAIPAILGASVLQLTNPELIAKESWHIYLSGIFTSFITGVAALYLLRNLVLKGKLVYFAWYCLFLGLIIILTF